MMARRLAVIAAALFAVIAGQVSGMGLIGQSPAEFSADSDAHLRVAGWAFAIWAPLYLGVLLFAGWHFRRADDPLARLMGWPAALAFVLTGAWVIAAGYDWEAATVVIIVSAALALLTPLWVRADVATEAGGWSRRMGLWPLAALAGWLTVASPVNLVTVLTGNGDLPGPAAAWSLGAVAFVAVAALAVSRRLRTVAYALPIAWGLVGVCAAELERNPPLASAAAGAALLSAGGGLWLSRRRR